MDILKISDNTLKLILTPDDMATYTLDYSLMDYDKSGTAEILKEIVKSAGDKCGFTSEGSKFYVQLYASAKGECEIYVSRIDLENQVNTEKQRKNTCIYSFDNMLSLLQSCNRLKTAKYCGESTAHKDMFQKKYYLIIEERSPLPEEHGGHLCKNSTDYYIIEHCKLICNDAVTSLGDLA